MFFQCHFCVHSRELCSDSYAPKATATVVLQSHLHIKFPLEVFSLQVIWFFSYPHQLCMDETLQPLKRIALITPEQEQIQALCL